MTRIRSVREVADFFKTTDPETAISEATIRQMIKEGTLPIVRVGVKQLLNLDIVLRILGDNTHEDGRYKMHENFNEFVINK